MSIITDKGLINEQVFEWFLGMRGIEVSIDDSVNEHRDIYILYVYIYYKRCSMTINTGCRPSMILLIYTICLSGSPTCLDPGTSRGP
jgi:hypothetical protein